MDPAIPCPHCQKPLPPDAPSGLCPECLLQAGLGTMPGEPPFTPPTPEALAPAFPQLEILALLGRGGMGAVYKARQKELDRIVALKILPPHFEPDSSFAERFTREARALAKLNHPHIVTLYDFGQTDGIFYFFMEYVEGVNLRQLLQNGRLAPQEALAIVPQICDALQFAHERGIIHRDIKPENILLGRDGQVKIADFGVAKIVGSPTSYREGEPTAAPTPAPSSEMTEEGKVIGTPQYMAPEQAAAPETVDHRADIYSLGVVFYQMLTGELPGKQIEHPSRRVQIDVRLDEIVLRALSENPQLRYAQASVFKTEVETLAAALHPPQTPAISQVPGVPKAPMPPHPAPSFYPKAIRPGGYAGFWRRLMAFNIDYYLIAFLSLPLAMGLATIAPHHFQLNVPFDLWTKQTILSNTSEQLPQRDGSTHFVQRTVIEMRPLPALGDWRYLVEETKTIRGHINTTTLIPVNSVTNSRALTILLLLIYWIAMESSRAQTSVGKWLMGSRVADAKGQGLSVRQALARNASKLLSTATLFIGFMAAGWTVKKQALHDTMTHSYHPRIPPEQQPWLTRLRPFIVLAVFVLSSYAESPQTKARELTTERDKITAPMTLSFDCAGDTMATIVHRLRQEQQLRLCFEDLDFDAKRDGVTIEKVLRDLSPKEKSKTLTLSERRLIKIARELKANGSPDQTLLDVGARYDQMIEAQSIGDLLTLLTKGSPYDFTQIGKTWVIKPRGYSRLAYPVSLDTEGLRVEEAIAQILSQQPTAGSIQRPPMIIMGPVLRGQDRMPWNSVFLPPMTLTDLSALNALCKISESSVPDSLWDLVGYHDGRNLNFTAGPGWQLSVINAAQSWLATIDEDQYAQSWKDASPFFKKSITEPLWVIALTTYRQPLGVAQYRRLNSATHHRTLPGAPDGDYLVMQFETEFEKKAHAIETVTFTKEADGTWRASGYFIK